MVVVGGGGGGGGPHTRMNFELFWSEIGYRWLKQPGYGFDLELAMAFR